MFLVMMIMLGEWKHRSRVLSPICLTSLHQCIAGVVNDLEMKIVEIWIRNTFLFAYVLLFKLSIDKHLSLHILCI